MHYRFAQVENISEALKFDFLYNENELNETQNYLLILLNLQNIEPMLLYIFLLCNK